MGISQQFETQHDNPLKVIYVQGGWLSGIDFQVTSTRFELKELRPALIFGSAPSPSWSKFAPTWYLSRFNPSPRRLKYSSFCCTPRDCVGPESMLLRVAWLGYFSLKQMNNLESHFQLSGHIPWNELTIYLLWSKLHSHVEEAWLALD